ncbi:hypothetical protein GCM10011331_22730 [Flavimobilis marinus]|uniref:Flagellar M-ring protein n=1 Tax=Flavimobilis marinus TaxID=285351 RepID=A0A1I2GQE3_9MICO|nr:flagellar basal-body MS-ring/collar protein FliF [Flavimobilis marinus]GHG55800.1 hypothetical protein GCM10011331_22730 [Flavimobilis marinus]SFF19260.1 flagellar M-ring protein FliF [Flavimobilis marinus]
MPRQITSAFGKLGAAIREFTVAQRTLALIGLAVLVLVAVTLSTWMAKPSYSPLYTGLAATDASAIVEQLDAEGVPYELADGGSSVMVPQGDVYRMRLATAAAGLPGASEGGYSLLDEMGMSSSEFQQDVTYKRAMEGELAKTIGAVQGVRAASVQLALPEQTVFVDEKQDPTASVFVELGNGSSLSDDQVQSIVHLVSASIEGMATTDVAVIDSTGTVLSAVGGTAGTSGGSNKQTMAYEDRVASSIQGMLEPIVGIGNAVVSVTAELDFDQTQRTSEEFAYPEEIPALNESTTTEAYEGTGGGGAGVLGPDNIAVPENGDGAGSYENESATRNNALNKVTEVVQTAPGTVRRQSVSVAISQEAGAALNMNDVQAMVAAAAGIDAARGDVVTVNRLQFSNASADAAQVALADARAAAEAERQSELIRTGVIAGAALLGLIIIAILAARARKEKRLEREALDIGDLNAIEAGPSVTALALEAVEEAEEALALEAPVEKDADQVEAERKRADVGALVDDEPDQVAQMLRAWMEPGVRS